MSVCVLCFIGPNGIFSYIKIIYILRDQFHFVESQLIECTNSGILNKNILIL